MPGAPAIQFHDLRDDVPVVTDDAVRVYGWRNHFERAAGSPGSCIGCVFEEPARLACDAGVFDLSPGMFFAVPGGARVTGGAGFLIEQFDFDALFQIGGPVETTGRLRYIDGCTDTLLISPPLRGDPCLNLLHIPPGTRQTRHNHPSFRAGLILRGAGHCVTPTGREALHPGLIFFIPTGANHSFHTEDSALLVIAYHPDTDFGPTHADHPMVNRTIVNGVSAAQLDDLRTKEFHGDDTPLRSHV